ncbi:MAG TPA: sugar kinase [Bacillota bacterium]|nr:sugar kinase [Bacillota bacterium]
MDVIAIGETLVSLTAEPKGFMRHAKQFIPSVAGAETNTLIGLSRLGHHTGWISKLGADELGKMILSTVQGEGVDTSQVRFSETNPTGIFFKEMVHESDVSISYYRQDSAASQLTASDLSEVYLTQAQYLYITGITPALSESCRELVFYAIDAAKKNGVTVVFDPNVRRKLWDDMKAKKTLLDIAKRVDIIIPGINEASFLLDNDDPKQVAKAFLKMGISLVVIKLGAKGAYYATASEADFVPAFHVTNVVDPVGAGDGFAAGLLSGLLEQKSLKEAVTKACAVGAMVTMVNGDFEGLPDASMLDRFMTRQYDDVHR